MNSILVREMMVPLADYATVTEDATLYEAVMALKEAQRTFDQDRYRHRAVLVLDRRQHVVGKVSQFDVLKALEPKYRGLAGDIKELEGLYGLKTDSIRQMIADYGLGKQPLDDVCRKAGAIKVRDIMYTPTEGEYVSDDATLNEAIHQLILGHHQSLLVTHGTEIVGVLRLTDVFHRVTEMIESCAL